MTLIVGAFCQDGIVIGADSSSTFTDGQTHTIEQPTEKIKLFGDNVIAAGTGQIGLNQRFCAILKDFEDKKQFQKHTGIKAVTKLSSIAVQDFMSTGLSKPPLGVAMAFVAKDGFHLCEFTVNDFQPELKTATTWFVSMGSGQHIADPFLGLLRRVFWKDSQPTLSEGIFAVAWALDLAIEINPGGINGPARMATLSKGDDGVERARMLSDDELAEHRENVLGAEKYLSEYRDLLSGATGPAPPVAPDPA